MCSRRSGLRSLGLLENHVGLLQLLGRAAAVRYLLLQLLHGGGDALFERAEDGFCLL